MGKTIAITMALLLLAGGAMASTNSWSKSNTGTEATDTRNVTSNLEAGSCVFLNLVAADVAATFSAVLSVEPASRFSVEFNPNTAAATTGPTIELYRCDSPSASTTNECRLWDKDRDGDGIIDESPLTGAVGYAGWDGPSVPSALAVKVVTAPTGAVVSRVKVCTAK